ncbi:MAG: hypothetical protein ACOYBE_05370 [Blautia sp.]|jgi:hypothetical protein
MVRIQKTTVTELTELVCNRCGKKIKIDHGTAAEGVCTVQIQWGYFSRKDGERHIFDLCEDCYDEIIGGFAVPVEIQEMTELV